MDQVVITSIVRDGMGYLDRYADQVDQLARLLDYRGLELVVMIAENDSIDGTKEWLTDWPAKSRAQVRPFHFPNGGPKFGSVDHPVRWRNIAATWNRLFANFPAGPEVRAAVYVETDLIWNPATILALLDRLVRVPAVAPMIFLQQTNRFYDTWGFRRDGAHFDPWPPYHPVLADYYGNQTNTAVWPGFDSVDLVALDCAASCWAMRSEVARGLTFSAADAMPATSLRERGYSIYLDPRLRVDHP